jgi:hypothetical protein
MRRFLTSFLALTLFVAGICPLTAPVNADHREIATATAAISSRSLSSGITAKRASAATNHVTVFAHEEQYQPGKLAFGCDSGLLRSAAPSRDADWRTISTRAPPQHLTSSAV